jgi:hypothetical protein
MSEDFMNELIQFLHSIGPEILPQHLEEVKNYEIIIMSQIELN